MSELNIPVAVGELIDKITILGIKSERSGDPAKLENIRRELDLLEGVWRDSPYSDAADIAAERAELKQVNEGLWEIEDDIRAKEAAKAFDDAFVGLARAVYKTNDRRAAIKRRINEATGSTLIEEKSYEEY